MELSLQIVLRLAAVICFALCVVLAFLAGMFYRRDRIREVKDDLAGRARQNSTAQRDLSGQSLKQLRAIRAREEEAIREKGDHADEVSQPSVTPPASVSTEGSNEKEDRSMAETPSARSVSVSAMQGGTVLRHARIQNQVAAAGAVFQVTKSIEVFASEQMVEIG